MSEGAIRRFEGMACASVLDAFYLRRKLARLALVPNVTQITGSRLNVNAGKDHLRIAKHWTLWDAVLYPFRKVSRIRLRQASHVEYLFSGVDGILRAS